MPYYSPTSIASNSFLREVYMRAGKTNGQWSQKVVKNKLTFLLQTINPESRYIRQNINIGTKSEIDKRMNRIADNKIPRIATKKVYYTKVKGGK